MSKAPREIHSNTLISTPPTRGFPLSEFEQRTERAQRMMAEHRLDTLLLTTEPDFRYFSGFQSQFWQSPTRPWFLIVPSRGQPLAVIPDIGAAGMAKTWLDDIHTWPAPQPEDDGISLLIDTLRAKSNRHHRIGIPMGHETHIRMPAADFLRLRERLGGFEITDASPLIRNLQVIKSAAEIDKIRFVCQLTSNAFARLPSAIAAGMSEREICRRLKMDLLQHGADDSPYLIGGSGPDGYDDIIMGPTDRVLQSGDVMIIDTGTTYDGYFCDFDRNFAFGAVSDKTRHAYDVVFAATEAGLQAARPGATACDLWAAMWRVLEQGGALGNAVGRLGHGLGMRLTEWPSNRPGDNTVLKPGMVMTLEPGMLFAPGKMMVHEENIVIREDRAELLTQRAAPEIPLVR